MNPPEQVDNFGWLKSVTKRGKADLLLSSGEMWRVKPQPKPFVRFFVWISQSLTALDSRSHSACSCQSPDQKQTRTTSFHNVKPWITLLKNTVSCCCYCISLILSFRGLSCTYWKGELHWPSGSPHALPGSLWDCFFDVCFFFPQEILVCVIIDCLHLSCYLHFSISVLFKDFFTNIVCTILIAAFNSEQQCDF